MNKPRKRANSVFKKTCCYRESWKDYWKNKDTGKKVKKPGQNTLKFLLFLELIYFLVYNTFIMIESEVLKDESSYLAYFHSMVEFWLLFGSIYFLWHSINRSIVVELISYTITFLLLNLYQVWRLVDDLWITKSLKLNFDDSDSDSQKTLATV
jgi:hypothetical protein